ncbi:MAG: ABC transporter ATP-binding protein [Desulfotomaculaceae bacterium]|nr:ABC transporter ATP-binding protein [Desulfotomaculaceae bacterium]
MDMLISLDKVERVYGRGSSAVKALDIGKLQIDRGEFVAVTGPSGGGKTTLLNLLGALDRPSRGRILVDGKDLTALGGGALCRYRREKVGFIFQAYCLLPTLSALQNVLTPALPQGAGRATRDRARQLLRRVGLAGAEKRLPGELSGGEQQRVAIARALLLDPDLILADEPTGNLDSVNGKGIIELLKDLHEMGKTVLVASHDQRVADSCSRVLRLVDGALVS